MSQSDPTDSALAAIASILDQPQSPPDKPPVEEPPAVPQPVEAHGYSKVGPGPMAAIRFKWAVREDNGHYYVDETVGENSTPIVSGPMDRETAIQFVDDREREGFRPLVRPASAVPGNPSSRDRRLHDAGCRRLS